MYFSYLSTPLKLPPPSKPFNINQVLKFTALLSGTMAQRAPRLAVRGTTGIALHDGHPSYEPVPEFPVDSGKNCKSMLFSPHGDYFAWANGIKITILKTTTWEVAATLNKPRTIALQFSPKGTYLAAWEPFSSVNPDENATNNLSIYRTSDGQLISSFEHKKQINWEPSWTGDELYCSRIVNNDVLFYKGDTLESTTIKLANQRVHQYKLSPNAVPPYHMLTYIPGKQGQPSFVKLFQFPEFDTPVASKSFFQADRVEMFWNKKGTAVLVLATVDVDKTGSSYYGNQTLHFLSTKGNTSSVQLNREGPIHSVAWSPLSTEFVVIFGFMPAKATIFNMECDAAFEMGTGPRNSIYFNPQGNILLLGGFGNLQGYVELWEAPTRKLITKLTISDTTYLEWCPDGIHFLTATTAPRLRISNGFKVWHHSGALQFEKPWPNQVELWEVQWEKVRDGTFNTPSVSYTPVKGITPSGPQASKEVYRPPVARGKPSTFKLNDDIVTPRTKSESKSAIKQRKKRESKRAKAAAAAAASVDGEISGSGAEADGDKPAGASANGAPPVKCMSSFSPIIEVNVEDPEKRKKMLKIKTKLGEINKIKELQKSGRQLEVNQLEKLKKEDSLLEEMKALTL